MNDVKLNHKYELYEIQAMFNLHDYEDYVSYKAFTGYMNYITPTEKYINICFGIDDWQWSIIYNLIDIKPDNPCITMKIGRTYNDEKIRRVARSLQKNDPVEFVVGLYYKTNMKTGLELIDLKRFKDEV
jgi:hypothetical protein